MATSQAEQQRKQQELDSIFSAARDELDEESNDGSEAEQNVVEDHRHARSDDDNAQNVNSCDVVGDDAATATTATEQNHNDHADPIGVPYSLEYQSNNKQSDEGTLRRPQFGPEPPPLHEPSLASPPPSSLLPLPPFDLPPGNAE